MKKIFLLLLGAMMMTALHAQVVEQNEPAVVYYSPKTAVYIDFTYTIETEEAGLFAKYAKELLGAEEAIKDDKTTYTLTNARISTVTSTDFARPHKVVAENGVPLLLSINEKQILKGYNLPLEPKVAPKRAEPKHEHPRVPGPRPAPFPEEVLKAGNTAAQAKAAAQQIFHLREMRTYLLGGEVEHAPADGKAMQLVLEELDRQEQALTELFVGKKFRRTEHKEVRFDPGSKDQQWFFSEGNGFTDAENVEAEVINVNVLLFPQRYAIPEIIDPKAKKAKGPELTQIVYNLPGSGEVKVQYKGAILAQRTIAIAQLGVDVPLAKELFTGKELPVIIFNEKTGNIESISK